MANELEANDFSNALGSLPKTFVQALYHAVTGKTENYSSDLFGNVEIRHKDVDQLYNLIKERIEHYEILAQPTVTVIVKDSKNKSITYSSWERFKKLEAPFPTLTSEIDIKIELILKLPNTPQSQRCVLNINLDFGLPVITDDKGEKNVEMMGFFLVLSRNWRAVRISVDFVDYLVARTFVATIEDWFSCLTVVPKSRLATFFARYMAAICLSLPHLGRAGVGAFLAGYVWFNGGVGTPTQFVYAVSIALTLWALFQIAIIVAGREFSRRVSLGMLPSVLLLTEADERAYTRSKARLTNSMIGGGGVVLTNVVGLALNVFASYLYAALS